MDWCPNVMWFLSLLCQGNQLTDPVSSKSCNKKKRQRLLSIKNVHGIALRRPFSEAQAWARLSYGRSAVCHAYHLAPSPCHWCYLRERQRLIQFGSSGILTRFSIEVYGSNCSKIQHTALFRIWAYYFATVSSNHWTMHLHWNRDGAYIWGQLQACFNVIKPPQQRIFFFRLLVTERNKAF